VGTAAAAAVAVATVSVAAQFIGITAPASDTLPYCAEAYQCVQPGADRLFAHGLDPLVAYGPAMRNSGMAYGPVASTETDGAV
jgi:hypothetical protein